EEGRIGLARATKKGHSFRGGLLLPHATYTPARCSRNYLIIPNLSAAATACVRESAPSSTVARHTQFLMVPVVMFWSSAICREVAPLAMSCNVSISRLVSGLNRERLAGNSIVRVIHLQVTDRDTSFVPNNEIKGRHTCP